MRISDWSSDVCSSDLIEDVMHEADIFVTTTGNRDVITFEHMQAMKNNALVCNIGHFDNEIQMDRLNAAKDVSKESIKPQVDRYTFPSGRSIYLLAEGRLVNLGCAHGHPAFVLSNSFSNQTLDIGRAPCRERVCHD